MPRVMSVRNLRAGTDFRIDERQIQIDETDTGKWVPGHEPESADGSDSNQGSSRQIHKSSCEAEEYHLASGGQHSLEAKDYASATQAGPSRPHDGRRGSTDKPTSRLGEIPTLCDPESEGAPITKDVKTKYGSIFEGDAIEGMRELLHDGSAGFHCIYADPDYNV